MHPTYYRRAAAEQYLGNVESLESKRRSGGLPSARIGCLPEIPQIIGLGKKQHTETEEQGCRWGLLRDLIRDFIVTAGTGIKVLIGGIQKGGC